MTMRAPFNPQAGANLLVSLTAAGPSVSSPINPKSKSVRLVNSGANICYVRIGFSSVTASTADTPVLPNSSLIISKAEGFDTIAYISAAGTSLNIQTGEGGV